MRPIEKVAVIGAGNMGSGIAQKSAQEDFEVQMVDREEKWVNRGHEIVSGFLSEAVERRIFKPEKVEQIKSRIRGVVGTGNVDPGTDLVIEAVSRTLASRLRFSGFSTMSAMSTPYSPATLHLSR